MANMAVRSIQYDKIPLIVILGSTATGKSKLAIGLAKALNGEIISADSMQVYRGLDIITNKVTQDEQEEVPHHMINIISPPAEFTVVQFKKMAMKHIETLHTLNKLPIIVGGTNYYIESLLWDFLVDKETTMESTQEGLEQRKNISSRNDANEEEDLCSHHEGLYEQLKKVDPKRAENLHSNNIRKIARSLQIYNTTGKTHSKLLEEQKEKYGSSHLSGPMRFSNSLVFWLRCTQETLNQRISSRMKKMVDEGLAEEISEFYEKYRGKKGDRNHDLKVSQEKSSSKESSVSSLDEGGDSFVDEMKNLISREEKSNYSNSARYSLSSNTENATNSIYEDGLYQAIGFKEFHEYLTCTENDKIEKDKLFYKGLEKLEQRTIKYSKKQVTWVQNRFLARPKDTAPDVYDLDVSNLEVWDENVFEKALLISNAFINDQDIPFAPMDREQLNSSKCNENRRYVCEKCDNKVIIGDTAWQAHTTSKKHRRKESRKRKLADV